MKFDQLIEYNSKILNSFFFEKYHQSYEKITFSFFKGVPENLVLCMSRNLRTTKNTV